MRTHETVMLGDLIVAAFDEAARSSRDPKGTSRLAALIVRRLLRTAPRILLPPLPASFAPGGAHGTTAWAGDERGCAEVRRQGGGEPLAGAHHGPALHLVRSR